MFLLHIHSPPSADTLRSGRNNYFRRCCTRLCCSPRIPCLRICSPPSANMPRSGRNNYSRRYCISLSCCIQFRRISPPPSANMPRLGRNNYSRRYCTPSYLQVHSNPRHTMPLRDEGNPRHDSFCRRYYTLQLYKLNILFLRISLPPSANTLRSGRNNYFRRYCTVPMVCILFRHTQLPQHVRSKSYFDRRCCNIFPRMAYTPLNCM